MSNKKLASEREFQDVKSAGNKLLWRLSPDAKGEFKHFKPNQNDFNALKSILGMINRIEKINVANNVVAAKLIIRLITQEARHNGTTVFDSSLLNQVSKILSYPLDSYYSALLKDIQGNQLNILLKHADTNNLIDKEVINLRSGKLELSEFLIHKYNGLENYIKLKQYEKISKEKQLEVIENYKEFGKKINRDYVVSNLNRNINELLLKHS